MLRLWQFAPAIVVFLGALVVAGGSFWAAFRQSNFNADIRNKNEQIEKLQQENIRILKGSEYFHFTVSAPDANGSYRLMSVNSNDLPIYDVYLIIKRHVDMAMNTPEDQARAFNYMENPERVELGTVPRGVKQSTFALPPGHHQIDIRTRFSKFTQMLKFAPFENVIGQSYILIDNKGVIIDRHTSPDGFPKAYND